jgi:hypothetical protein
MDQTGHTRLETVHGYNRRKKKWQKPASAKLGLFVGDEANPRLPYHLALLTAADGGGPRPCMRVHRLFAQATPRPAKLPPGLRLQST